MSHCTQSLKSKFTLIRNRLCRWHLNGRINPAAIVRPYGCAMVTVLRTPGDLTQVRSATCTDGVTMKNLIARFVKDESGATAIEYGLIAAGISLAIIAVVNGLGTSLSTKFNSINASLK